MKQKHLSVDEQWCPLWEVAVVVAIVVAGLFFLGSIAQAQSYLFTKNLNYGITNDQDVQALQEFLTTQGVYQGPITGNFYSLTQVGVKAFQAEHALPSTGYFGALSRGVANAIIADGSPAPGQDELATSTGGQATSSNNANSVPSQGACVVLRTPSGAIVDSCGHIISLPAQSTPPLVSPQPTQSPVQQDPAPVAASGVPSSGVAPTCTLSATVVLWKQDTRHAQFSWGYTPGAQATIDASDLWFGPQWRGNLARESSDQEDTLYGPTIFQTTTYTMMVSKDGLSGTCSATAAW